MNFSKPLKDRLVSGAGLIPFLIYAHAIFLPLRFNAKAPVFIALLLVFGYQQFQGKNRFIKTLFKSPFFWFIGAYFLLCLLSVLWSEDLSSGFRFALLQVSLPLLPLVYYQQLTQRQVKITLHLFMGSCFLLCLYSLGVVMGSYLKEFPGHVHIFSDPNLWKVVDWTYISYFLPQKIDFHAPFFSLYIGVCLIISSYYLYTAFPGGSKKRWLFYLFLCIFFLAFQGLLASRTALVATVLVISLAGVYTAVEARKYVLVGAVLLFTFGLGYLLYENVSYLQIKLSSKAGVSERAFVWNVARDLLQENPITGVGVGDRQNRLMEAYEAMHFKEGLALELNAHNQFLDTGVALGFPGMVLFFAMLLSSLIFAFRRGNYILFCAVLTIGLCCITESIFQRQDGVLLFSFVVALLQFAPKREEKVPSNS
jgi:O-antigen ligase